MVILTYKYMYKLNIYDANVHTINESNILQLLCCNVHINK